jgi:hypothetical protein
LISGYDDVYWKNAVWNYDPETDLYRWAAGKVDEPSNNFLARGDFGIPSPDVFPGGAVSWSATTIDHNDNIWIYGADYSPQYEFWRLNTTSLEFTYFGMNNNVRAAVGGDKGVPSTTTYPGHVEAGALFVDSQNNLWLFGGFYNNTTNTVWHFNTTSYMWTWVWGEVNTFVNPDFSTNYWNGRYSAGGFIDNNDRVWLFGGYGSSPSTEDQDSWNDIWSFDTKTLEWRVEWGNESSYVAVNSIVSDDFHPGNHPSGRYASQMIDRYDGTFMIVGGFEDTTNIMFNDIWLFNTTSKMWKQVYGLSDDSLPRTNFSNYRTPGSYMGTRRFYGSPSRNHYGNFFLNAGSAWDQSEEVTSSAGLNDIWVIPQDQCLVFNDCDENADCVSTLLGVECTCKAGYFGDGKTCTEPPSSAPVSQNSPSSNNGTPSNATPKAASTSDATRDVISCATIVALTIVLWM